MQKRNVNKNDISMGLIILTNIDAKISGIIFTCQPINPEEGSYRIEYCPGSGNKIKGWTLKGHSI